MTGYNRLPWDDRIALANAEIGWRRAREELWHYEQEIKRIQQLIKDKS